MALRPRITVRKDEAARRLDIRWIGHPDGRELVWDMVSRMEAIDAVWTYDMLFDLLRFDGNLTPVEGEALSAGWRNLAQGRDAGRRSAIVSRDPLVAARLSLTRESFPGRHIAVFGTIAEGEAWLSTPA